MLQSGLKAWIFNAYQGQPMDGITPRPTIAKPFWNMTTPGMKSQQADWNALGCQLTEMREALTALRDALVETELALRDYHFTLDTSERRTAEREAFRLIGRARS